MIEINRVLAEDPRLFTRICEATPGLNNKVGMFMIGGCWLSLLEIHWLANNMKNTLHDHNFFEFHVPFRGQCEVQSSGRKITFPAGSFSITPPGVKHCHSLRGYPLETLVFWILLEPVPQGGNSNSDHLTDLNMLLESADKLVYPLPETFMANFNMILTYLMSSRLEADSIVSYLFRALLLSLISNLRSRQAAKITKNLTGGGISGLSDRMFLSRVDEYLQNNLRSDLSLEEISLHFNISVRNITRRYLKCRGNTIWKTINNMRMTRAENLLQNSHLSIAEIAERCGFSCVSYFSSNFKKYFGYSPGTIQLKKNKID